jgi:signal transduction histidine kinase
MPANPVTGFYNLISLGFLTFGVATSGPVGLSGQALINVVLLVLATASWLAWLAARVGWCRPPTTTVALFGMALFGGLLASSIPLAMVFSAVAAMGATIARPMREVTGIVVAGIGALTVAQLIGTFSATLEVGAAAAILGGATAGITRRAALERANHAAQVELAQARIDAEGARAELLAARNHMARELHDVLAHTLAGLALQIEALEALMMADREPGARVTAQLEQIKRLVHEGLDEARGAVAALREDLPPLDERLEKLGAERHARVEVTGPPRAVTPEIALVLYRVAQEALTNALKHAPGAPVLIVLEYQVKGVRLAISNPAPQSSVPSAVAGSGGGYGLQGIKERILLIGGRVEAGPDGDGGWRVEAEVPA